MECENAGRKANVLNPRYRFLGFLFKSRDCRYAMFCVLFTLLFFLQDCVIGVSTPLSSTDSSRNFIWPYIYVDHSLSYEHFPTTTFSSAEEAIATIRSLQSKMRAPKSPFTALGHGKLSVPLESSWVPATSPYELNIDKDTLRLKYRWTEVHRKDTDGEIQLPREKEVLIPFKDIVHISGSTGPPVFSISSLSNLVYINFKLSSGGGEYGPESYAGMRAKCINLQIQSKKDMRLFLDSIYTLCYPFGFRNQFQQLGVHICNLTTSQTSELGFNEGVLVINVLRDMPTGRAGIKFLDIIQEINGTKIINSDQFWDILISLPFDDKPTINMKILRWAKYREERKGDVIIVHDINPMDSKEEKIIEIIW